MRRAASVIALASVMFAVACTSKDRAPDPVKPAPDGIGITITSARAEYRQGEQITLSVVLTNGLRTQCRMTTTADGSLAIVSLTRDGTPIAPTLVNGDYIGGFTEYLRANQAPVAAAGSTTMTWTSEDAPAALTTSTMDTLDRALIGAWPVAEPGRYELSARYLPPTLSGDSGDGCPGSGPATTTFTVTGS